MFSEESVGEPPPSMKEMQDQGWAQWAWSYVPQILPEDEEDGESVLEERRKLKPVVFSLGMYAYKLTVNFKVHILEMINQYSVNADKMYCDLVCVGCTPINLFSISRYLQERGI